MEPIMLGCDFEVFVLYGNVLVDARRMFPNATKENPIDYLGYKITHDRYSLECAIPPFEFSKENPEQFYRKVMAGVMMLESYLRIVNRNYKIVMKDWTKIDRPEKYSKGLEHTIYSSKPTQEEITSDIICNGLHIHFSGPVNKNALISILDSRLGKWYRRVCIFSKRKKYYGALGSYRDKQYDLFTKGFEYRTLGGKMLEEKYLIKISKTLNQILQ